MERTHTVLKALILIAFLVFEINSSQAQIVYVDQNATGTGDGASWTNAFTNLQTAIDAAATVATEMNPMQVWVKADTYYPTNGMDRDVSFAMKNDVKIYGGFSGAETLLAQFMKPFSQEILVLLILIWIILK